MKKTLKNKIASLTLAVMLASAAFTGCQMNGLIEDSSDSENLHQTNTSRTVYTDEEMEEIKGLVKDALKEKEEEDAANKKPDKFEYKGYNGAITKIATFGLDKAVDALGIENESLKELINIGTRTINAGTKFLDALLNKATGGLYGVALEILFPDGSGSKVDPNILKIQNQLTEMEKSISDVQKGIDQLGEDIITSADRTILVNRLNEVSSYKNNFATYAKFLSKKGGTVDYKTYLELKGKLKQMNNNSPDKLLADANTFFAQYNLPDKDFGKMYHSVAEASRPWRYQSNHLIRDFISTELSAGTTVYTVINALYNPDNNGNIYKEALVGYIISHNDELYTLYTDLMKPVESSNNFTEINQEKFDDFIARVNEAAATLSDKTLDEMAATALESNKTWEEFNSQFDSYVSKIDSIQIVDDKEGEITCNVAGAKYTFSTKTNTVNYGKNFKGFESACNLQNIWVEKDSWSSWRTITYGVSTNGSKALSSESDWMQVLNGAGFESGSNKITNKVTYTAPEKKSYEKIVNYYKDRGFAVTDGELSYMDVEEKEGKTYRAGYKAAGNAVGTTIANILKYDAGIEIGTAEFVVPDGSYGFKLEETGKGDWNIPKLHIASCKVTYLDMSSSSLDTKEFTVLDQYACDGDKRETMYRSHYYGKYDDNFQGLHEKDFSIPVIIANFNK